MSEQIARSELVIARHGQAHCNVHGVIATTTCTGLTERGRACAEALASRLAADPSIAAIYTSTTRRAHETATIIGKALATPVIDQPALRVPDAGDAEGLTWAQARARAGVDSANPVRPAANGAESWQAYLARSGAALQRITDQHPDQRVLVVGHSETVTAAFALLLGTGNLGRLKIAVDHTAITTFRQAREYAAVVVPQPRWELTGHNDITHISPTAAREV